MIRTGTTHQFYYTYTDHLGSIQELIQTNGTIAESYSFDSWGRRRNPTNWSYTNITNPTILRRGYTGHEHLDEFGLINMNARLYDPYIGPDNVLQDPTNAQNYNRYSYVLNNPLKYTDPTGNEKEGGSSFDEGAAFWASNAISHAHDYESWAHFFNQEKIDVYLQSTQGGGGAGSPVAGLNMGDVLASLESAENKATDEGKMYACETCPKDPKKLSAELSAMLLISVAEPTFIGELAFAVYASYIIVEYGPDAVKDAVIYMQRKGERGWQGKSQNTDNPYKKWTNHKTNPDKVMKPDRNGNPVEVPKPPDWHQWKRPDGGNISKRR